MNQFASIKSIYKQVANGQLNGFTVPAFNIRLLTFDLMKALFRAAQKEKAGLFVVELAQSEMEYTSQTPQEYAKNCWAAAKAENYQAPIFLQGDHFKLISDVESQILEKLIKKAIKAGFLNIDIDCSSLPLTENIKQTNYFIEFINKLNSKISIGAEIGEIGGKNTTNEQLEQFLAKVKGISKIAVQTGTAHGKGGQIDWQLVSQLTTTAKKYGLAGIVQHGASTLPQKDLKKLAPAEVCEVHLATEIMNKALESKYFPKELKAKIKTKKDLGPLKQEILAIPQKNIDKISEEIEELFKSFLKILKVSDTVNLVDKKY